MLWYKVARLGLVASLLVATTATTFGRHVSDGPPVERAWTAETSIEMRYFPLQLATPQHWPNSSDGSGILFSADRRYFLFAEYRGNLPADAGIVAIHIYDSEAVRRALQSGKKSVAPVRQLERQSRSSSLPAIGNIRWDEDSEGVFFYGLDGQDVRVVYHLEIGSGKLRSLGAWPSNGGGSLSFGSRGDTSVTFLTQPVRPSRVQTYPADWLTRDPAGNPQFEGEARRPNPEKIVEATARCAGRPAPAPRGVVPRVAVVAISPTECTAILVTNAAPSNAGWVYELLDIAKGRVTRLASAKSGRNSVIWSPNGRWALLSQLGGDGEDGQAGVAILDALTARLVPIAGLAAIPDPRQAGASWRGGEKIVVPDASSDSGMSQLTLREGKWERSRAASLASFSDPDAGLSVEITQDFNTPPEVIATLGRRRIVLSRSDPALAGVRRGRWREISWTGRDGEIRHAALMLPTGASTHPPPLVVNPYWYDRLDGSHKRLFLPDGLHEGAESAAQTLAARGIAVLWIDGWDNPSIVGAETEGAQFVERLDGALAELIRGKLVDPQRIGMAGFSRGGFLSLYSATHPGRYPIRTHVAIDNYMGSSAGTLYDVTNAVPNQGLGNFATNSAGWDEHDTLRNVTKVSGPVLFTRNFNGRADDPATAMFYAVGNRTMYGAFMQARRPFDVLTFPEGTHALTRPRERLALMNAIVDWMAFWLLDEAPRDPERARIWRQMRIQWQRQKAWEAVGNTVGSPPSADFQPPRLKGGEAPAR